MDKRPCGRAATHHSAPDDHGRISPHADKKRQEGAPHKQAALSSKPRVAPKPCASKSRTHRTVAHSPHLCVARGLWASGGSLASKAVAAQVPPRVSVVRTGRHKALLRQHQPRVAARGAHQAVQRPRVCQCLHGAIQKVCPPTAAAYRSAHAQASMRATWPLHHSTDL